MTEFYEVQTTSWASNAIVKTGFTELGRTDSAGLKMLKTFHAPPRLKKSIVVHESILSLIFCC